VVEELAGPDEAGSGWMFSVSTDDPRTGGRSFWLLPEDELERVLDPWSQTEGG